MRVPAETIFMMPPLQKVLQDFSSALPVARMCFLIACREGPFFSFWSATAIIVAKAVWERVILGRLLAMSGVRPCGDEGLRDCSKIDELATH